MEVRTGLAIGGCVGVVVGLLGGRVWEVSVETPTEAVVAAPEKRAPLDGPERAEARLAEPPVTARSVGSRQDPAPDDEQPATSVRSVASEDALIGAALARYAEDEIAAGWSELRTDPIPADRARAGFAEFEDLVRVVPRALGRRLAQLQTERELAEGLVVTDDPIRLLESLAEPGVGPVPDLVRDPARFAALFRREHEVRFLDGTDLGARPDDSLEDGTVIRFPAGVFAVDRLLDHTDPFPAEVTLEGAGMDATLLVVSKLSARSALRKFAIRDCTAFSDRGQLIDLGGDPATVEFERVRFVGFDSGAGGSSMFGGKENALRMTDCLVEGGYGRLPGSGVLWKVRTDGFVARLERCEFRHVRMGLDHIRAGATIVFSQCRLQGVLDDVVAHAEALEGVFLEDCLVLPFDGERRDVPRRDLNDLFPGWQQAVGRR